MSEKILEFSEYRRVKVETMQGSLDVWFSDPIDEEEWSGYMPMSREEARELAQAILEAAEE